MIIKRNGGRVSRCLSVKISPKKRKRSTSRQGRAVRARLCCVGCSLSSSWIPANPPLEVELHLYAFFLPSFLPTFPLHLIFHEQLFKLWIYTIRRSNIIGGFTLLSLPPLLLLMLTYPLCCKQKRFFFVALFRLRHVKGSIFWRGEFCNPSGSSLFPPLTLFFLLCHFLVELLRQLWTTNGHARPLFGVITCFTFSLSASPSQGKVMPQV